MQNAESDTRSGDHYKGKERVIACLSTAKFLEAIEEPFYRVPVFIRLFIKRPRLLCSHLRWDRIVGEPFQQIASDLFCTICIIGKKITVLQVWK